MPPRAMLRGVTCNVSSPGFGGCCPSVTKTPKSPPSRRPTKSIVATQNHKGGGIRRNLVGRGGHRAGAGGEVLDTGATARTARCAAPGGTTLFQLPRTSTGLLAIPTPLCWLPAVPFAWGTSVAFTRGDPGVERRCADLTCVRTVDIPAYLLADGPTGWVSSVSSGSTGCA